MFLYVRYFFCLQHVTVLDVFWNVTLWHTWIKHEHMTLLMCVYYRLLIGFTWIKFCVPLYLRFKLTGTCVVFSLFADVHNPWYIVRACVRVYPLHCLGPFVLPISIRFYLLNTWNLPFHHDVEQAKRVRVSTAQKACLLRVTTEHVALCRNMASWIRVHHATRNVTFYCCSGL
jgi:hypothetical protein